jgi:hypothetical protein|tara:strand:+ start:6279 stop:6383 length:105 start_codon:yes stop_codon:yes gene_type:complete
MKVDMPVAPFDLILVLAVILAIVGVLVSVTKSKG